jgi:excreted virulence factor EspC (type VII ESX diderm)
MAQNYEVVTPALSSHVRGLTDVSAELSKALTAASVTVTGDAYGQPGTRLAAGLADVARTGQETLRSAIDALDRAAAAMRDTVTAYEREEQAAKDRMNKIAGERK